ncbi:MULTISPECIES: TraY domain-containing protein [Klebsiella]|uniref:TraY domain-containing protein n=1 Tax=Klebsiella TaxID=570 RepID=UPI000949566F|nr:MULTISPECIES: TraY domain-containing protein [Klebsiella]MDD9665858.1 TraY domain-containing protein [Klebsiella pasteurii]MDD9671237.1 TraY domain-containing protein [Klebsiella pasteurii]MDD9687264.1 TraY domain-containing protein [Klebsiella pasteurii]
MKRLVNRSASGSAVVFTCDDETYQNLILATRRSGRVKGTEVQLRVDDHLRKFPDFYDVQRIYSSDEKREKRLFLRFDERTNKMLIKAKNKSGRSKTLEVYLRLKAHLLEFPDFYSSEVDVIRRSEAET